MPLLISSSIVAVGDLPNVHAVVRDGVTYSLPRTLDFVPAQVEWNVPTWQRPEREGLGVLPQAAKLAGRLAHISGTLQFGSLAAAREELARLVHILSGDEILVYPRDTRDRYMRAVLTDWRADADVGGLLYRVEAQMLCPRGLWEAAVESTAQATLSQSGSVDFTVTVGGQWRVYPTVEFAAVGGSVTDPSLAVVGTDRVAQYLGTLQAGQTVRWVPEVPAVILLPNTRVTDKANDEWLDPSRRLWLPPGPVTLRLAATLAAGATVTATLRWVPLWP